VNLPRRSYAKNLFLKVQIVYTGAVTDSKDLTLEKGRPVRIVSKTKGATGL